MARRSRRVNTTRLVLRGLDTVRIETVACEEPLEIALDGEAWQVTMRTPGDDFDLVHGLLVSEGVITRADHVRRMEYGVEPDGRERSFNVVNVTLGQAAKPPAHRHVSYVSTACGICGSSTAEVLARSSAFPVAEVDLAIPAEALVGLHASMRPKQALFERTGGTHAAALFVDGEMIVLREDVGRHNAVDKVVGWAIRSGRLPLHDAVLQVSGRASFELVQKASMAGIPVMAAVSAPSAAAIDLAEEVGLTLAAFTRNEAATVYTRVDRINANRRT